MNRFFVDKDQISVKSIEIVGKDVKHIRSVLRLKAQDEIEVICEGITYICEIMDEETDRVSLSIRDSFKGQNEPPVEIVLYQGIAKGTKMDLIIQKATEIGISEIYPLISHRTVVKIKDKKKEQKKIDRWKAIVEEAGKQSKRDRLPDLHDIIDFHQMIDILKDQNNIIVPYEEEKSYGLKQALKTIEQGKIHVIIGPEGGFEQDEIRSLQDIKGKSVTLGRRILRTETAGLVVGSIILYELGDLGVIL